MCHSKALCMHRLWGHDNRGPPPLLRGQASQFLTSSSPPRDLSDEMKANNSPS